MKLWWVHTADCCRFLEVWNPVAWASQITVFTLEDHFTSTLLMSPKLFHFVAYLDSIDFKWNTWEIIERMAPNILIPQWSFSLSLIYQCRHVSGWLAIYVCKQLNITEQSCQRVYLLYKEWEPTHIQRYWDSISCQCCCFVAKSCWTWFTHRLCRTSTVSSPANCGPESRAFLSAKVGGSSQLKFFFWVTLSWVDIFLHTCRLQLMY